MPKLKIQVAKLKHNILLAKQIQTKLGINFLPVVKMVACHSTIIKLFVDAGFNLFGTSDLGEYEKNLQKEEKIYINLVPIHKTKDIVSNFYRSSFSSLECAKAINQAAKEQGLVYNVLMAVDIGDMREGIPIQSAEKLAKEILDAKLGYINIQGIGVNFGCLQGIEPSLDNFTHLKNIHAMLQKKLNQVLPIISIGGSVCFEWLLKNSNLIKNMEFQLEFRTGDVFFLGYNMYKEQDFSYSGFEQNIFELEAEVLEIYEKDMPHEAFEPLLEQIGKYPNYSGCRKRMLIDCGLMHTDMSNISHKYAGVELVGVCGNYAVFDVNNSNINWKVGDKFQLCPGYWAVANIFRNISVEKEFY